MAIEGLNSIPNPGVSAQRPEDKKNLPGAVRTESAQPKNLQPAGDNDNDVDSQRDTLEISSQASALLAARKSEGPAPVDNNTALRPEAVDKARQILQSGTYNSEGSLNKTAEELGQLFRSEG
jgi:hypothetical protein